MACVVQASVADKVLPGQCAFNATPSRRLGEVRFEWKVETINMRFGWCGNMV